MNELKPELRSTIQVPVRLSGGFGRGFARLSGASAPSGNGSPGLAAPCACVPKAMDAIPSATKAALSAIFFVSLVICHPFQLVTRAATMGPGVTRERSVLRRRPARRIARHIGEHGAISEFHGHEASTLAAIAQRVHRDGDLIARLQRGRAPAGARHIVRAVALDAPLVRAARGVGHLDLDPAVWIRPTEADDRADEFNRLIAIEHRARMMREGRSRQRAEHRGDQRESKDFRLMAARMKHLRPPGIPFGGAFRNPPGATPRTLSVSPDYAPTGCRVAMESWTSSDPG